MEGVNYHTPSTRGDNKRRDKLINRIEGMLAWMDYQEINLTFWDELRYLLQDIKKEIE